MAQVTKFKTESGFLFTTDHRPVGPDQWQPAFCPQLHSNVDSDPDFTPPRQCGGDCPFFTMHEKGGKWTAQLACYGQVIERELESV